MIKKILIVAAMVCLLAGCEALDFRQDERSTQTSKKEKLAVDIAVTWNPGWGDPEPRPDLELGGALDEPQKTGDPTIVDIDGWGTVTIPPNVDGDVSIREQEAEALNEEVEMVTEMQEVEVKNIPIIIIGIVIILGGLVLIIQFGKKKLGFMAIVVGVALIAGEYNPWLWAVAALGLIAFAFFSYVDIGALIEKNRQQRSVLAQVTKSVDNVNATEVKEDLKTRLNGTELGKVVKNIVNEAKK